MMKTERSNILDILGAQAQYIIPIYQRPYSWDNKQISKLWDDIVDVHNLNKEDYFIGSMVAVAETPMPNEINQFIIIDGQQRLTTLIIFLTALRDSYFENKQYDRAEQIHNSYLTTKYLDNIYRRIESRKNDDEVLACLIEKREGGEKSSRVLHTYNFFKDKIKKSNISYDELQMTVRKLWLVQIVLDRGHGDAQSIFESLNSTGKDLTESDLIRNFLLMDLNPTIQEKVYQNYWVKFEQLFTFNDILDNETVDNFIRDYLTLKTGNISRKDKIYDDFKKYFHYLNIENKNVEICKDLYKKGKIYSQIINGKYDGDSSISKILKSIKDLDINVTYPFFMYLLDLYQEGFITSRDVCKVLEISISFIIRRNICQLPSNVLNKKFALAIAKAKPDNLVNSVSDYLTESEGRERFPKDDEFSEEFIEVPMYNLRTKRYILKSLEEFNNKNTINIDNVTIEHIMPQGNLNIEWQEMIGENYLAIRETNVHKIGNLTLTNYNSEMSNSDFLTKLNMHGGIKLTPYKLNQYFIKNDIKTWNAEEIRKRGELLSAEALKIWKYPDVDAETIEKRKMTKTQYSIDSFRMNENTRDIFNKFDELVRQLDENITRYITGVYVVYQLNKKSFLSISFRVSKFVVGLHLNFDEVNDYKNICRDVTNIGHLHLGNTELPVTKEEDLEYAMELVKQSFNKNK
ncbi:GmrSD restriction endonuclease domain-containing protein [Mycoplasma sp. HF14]